MASGSGRRPRAYILITGEEVLSGRVVDRNSAAVAGWARRAGLEPGMRLTVGDRMDDILLGLDFLRDRGGDVLFVLGGLGPTPDDVTRDAVARWLGRPLILHEESRLWIEEVYRLRGLILHEGALRQAYLPQGALPIPNRVGTAPGFMVPGEPRVVVLPGPPRELLPMEEKVMAFLAQEFPRLSPQAEKSLFIADYAESAVAQRAKEALGFRPGLEWATYVHPGAVEIHLQGDDPAEVDRAAEELEKAFGSKVFSREHADLARAIGEASLARGWQVAVAESCTGGLAAAALTAVPGASRWFLGGQVVYTEGWKERWLEIPHELLSRHGAVSREVTLELARRLKKATGAHLTGAVTCYAGPAQEGDRWPVGTTFVAWCSDKGEGVEKRTYAGSRSSIRERAAWALLALLWEQLHP